MIESPDSEQSTPRAGQSDAEAGEGDNNAFESPADRESLMQQRSSMRPSASTAASASQRQQQQRERERQQQQPPLQRSAAERRAGAPAQSLPDESTGAGAKQGGKRRARVVEAPPPPAGDDDGDDGDLLEPEPEAPAYEAEPSPSLARSSKRAPAVNASEPATRAKPKPAPGTQAQPRRQPPPESTALDGERPSRSAKRPSASAAQRPALQNGSESAQMVNAPRGREQSRERRTPNTASAQRRIERPPDDFAELEPEPELDGAASAQMERDSLGSEGEEANELVESANANAAPTRQTRRPQSGARVERAPSRERAAPAGQWSALPSRPRAGPALASTFDDGSALLDDAAAPALGAREAIGRLRPARQPLEQADSEASPAVYTRSMAPLSGSLRERTPSPSLAAAAAREQVPATRLITRSSPLPRLERERTYYISEEELVVPGPPPPASVGPSAEAHARAYERNSNCPLCGSPVSFAGLDRQEHERLHQQREAELLAQRRAVPAGAAPAGSRFTTRRPVLVEREYVLDEPSTVGVPARYMRPLEPAEFADPELQRQAQLLEQHADARAALPDEYFLPEQPLMCEFIPYMINPCITIPLLDQSTRCYLSTYLQYGSVIL